MRLRWGALLLAWLLWPAWGLALPAVPYAPQTMLWYPALTEAQQGLFDLFYQAAAQGTAAVELPPGSRYDDVCAALDALLRDCPELSWLSRQYTVRYYRQQPEAALGVTLAYTGAPGETAHIAAADALARSVAGAEPWEQALALHDALCQLLRYGEGSRAHDAYGALAEGLAVCDGYAAAYALACRLAGIRCGVLVGEGQTDGAAVSHAWNLVVLEEGAMHVDLTWDDQEGLGRTLHSYFGLTDAWLAADHREEPFLHRPACEAPGLNWHVRRGLAVGERTEADLRQWWEAQLAALWAQGGGTVEARFLDGATFALFLERQGAWLDAWNQARGSAGLYGEHALLTTREQQVFALTWQP